MKINKRFLQFIAAFMILIYHVWVSVSHLPIEAFIIRTGYIGVDLFFFLSAYSLADKQIEYKSFLKNRFGILYSKFAVFAIVALIYKKFRLVRVIKALVFVEFFQRGGGAFLWFIPAILLFYLVYPLFIRWNNKYKVAIVAVSWLIVVCILQYLFGYTDVFILLNRIPVMLLGFVLKKKKIPNWACVVSLIIGIVLAYFFKFKPVMVLPITELYYVLGAFITVGLAGLSGLVKQSAVWDVLSMGTLELYGLQMIFGMKLANALYKATSNAIVTNVIVVVFLFGASILLSKAFEIIQNTIESVISNPEAK